MQNNLKLFIGVFPFRLFPIILYIDLSIVSICFFCRRVCFVGLHNFFLIVCYISPTQYIPRTNRPPLLFLRDTASFQAAKYTRVKNLAKNTFSRK